MIFKNHSYELCFWNWFVNAATSQDFKTHNTLEMQAKEHDLIKYVT